MSAYLKSISALYKNGYDRRTKSCLNCGIEYCDVTVRCLFHTCCRECGYTYGVSKRQAKGSYVRTEEQNEKTRISVKHTFSSRNCFSKETREKLSETMKRSWKEGKIKPHDRPRKPPRKKVIRKKLSDESRAKMSRSQQLRVRTKRQTLYTSAIGGKRPDLNDRYFRSRWEANFARVLNVQGKQWEYEPKTFQLSEMMSYTPDFYLPEERTWIEIKGQMNDRSREQIELFRQRYPEENLVVVDGVHYGRLRLEWKHQIENWEGK